MQAFFAAIMVVPALVAGTLGHAADAAAQSAATVPHIGFLDGTLGVTVPQTIPVRAEEMIE
ncbi:hypothetical protein SAMN05519104_0722 [Rhizobiales bacterium GAS188]|nr:hypothetical protein SAMN05519104_0722 [Rhizobiales bacterium GAS188]